MNIEKAKTLFEEYDQDKDQFIIPSEFRKLCQKEYQIEDEKYDHLLNGIYIASLKLLLNDILLIL